MAKTRYEEVMKKFKQAKTKRQAKDPLWKELDAFDRNEQWDLNGAPSWLPKPVTNYIHLVKYTKRAAFAVDNPTGKLRPLSYAGVESVKLLNKAYEDTVDRIKMRKVVRENIGTAKLLGTAFAHIYWDEFHEGSMGTTIHGDEGFQYEGEIRIKEIEPSSFYPDPQAFRIEDCEFVIVRERKSLEWLKKHPELGKSWKEDSAEGNESPQDRGEIYLRDYDTEQKDGLVTLTTYYEKKRNDEGGFTYTVEHAAVGRMLGEKKKLRPNRFPFVALYDFQQRQDFWGMSTCQFILDNQKIVNKVESIIAMIGLLLQNPQKVVSKESNIDPRSVAKHGNTPQQVWHATGDPTRAIHYVQPPQIPNTLINLLEQAKQNIREITGLTESYMGQNVGSLQTSSGVQALIDRSTMRDRDQMYDIELYIEELSKLVIDFMTTYYEEERLVRVLGKKDDDVQFIPFTGTDFKDLAYDIAVDVSAKTPITRMKEQQDAKELLNLQGQYGQNYPVPIINPKEAIEMMNLTHSDRIIERMEQEELTNKTEQAMQVAQMMSEALGQGVPEEEVIQMGNAMFEQIDQIPQQEGGQQVEDPNSFNPQNIPEGMG